MLGIPGVGVFSCRHLIDVRRMERFQERACLAGIELRIVGLDQQEESILRRQVKIRSIEERVIGLREPIQSKHPEGPAQPREEDSELEGYGNERRPRVKRSPTDINRIVK